MAVAAIFVCHFIPVSNTLITSRTHFCCLSISWWMITFNLLDLRTVLTITITATRFRQRNSPAAPTTAYWATLGSQSKHYS